MRRWKRGAKHALVGRSCDCDGFGRELLLAAWKVVADPALPLFAMYSRCCTFHIGRAHVRPAIPAVLDLLAGPFDPAPVTSAIVAWDDAIDALAEPPMKLVIARPGAGR